MSSGGSVSRDLLFEFAFGGLAENIDQEIREELHIDTPVDRYLKAATEEGYRVILTGNPGDGKTQHLLRHRSSLDESHTEFYQPTAEEDLNDSYDMYYEPDGSRLENQIVLNRLKAAVENNIPGVLAINEGVIQEMVHQFDEADYPFLETLDRQIRNQILYQRQSDGQQHNDLNDKIQQDIENFGIVVIDLGLRNVLTETTIREALNLLEANIAESEDADNHITANVEAICGTEQVKENIIQFLQIINEGTPDTHYTVRDLFQFLSAVITGGKRQGRPDYGSELEYQNLIYEQPDTDRRGIIGEAVDELFTTTRIVHPQIDTKLWTKVENEISREQGESTEEVLTRLRTEFKQLKRETLFHPESVFGSNIHEEGLIGESEGVIDLLSQDSNSFDEFMNEEELLYETIKLVNQYFDRTTSEDGQLFLWTSQTYKSRSTDAFISRTEVRARDFECRFPTLNGELRDAQSLDEIELAIDYLPDHYRFTYTGSESGLPVSIRFDSHFWKSIQFLDVGIPYELRSDQQEQRLLRFMERVENREPLGPTSGTVKVQDTAESDVTTIDITGDAYEVGDS